MCAWLFRLSWAHFRNKVLVWEKGCVCWYPSSRWTVVSSSHLFTFTFLGVNIRLCYSTVFFLTSLLPDEVTHLGILIILYPVHSETEDIAQDDTSLIKHSSLNPIMFYTPDNVTKLLCLQHLRCDIIHLQPLHVSFLVQIGASFNDTTTYTKGYWNALMKCQLGGRVPRIRERVHKDTAPEGLYKLQADVGWFNVGWLVDWFCWSVGRFWPVCCFVSLLVHLFVESRYVRWC